MADGSGSLPPPVEVEQALLGALLINNAVFNHCGGLRVEDFADPLHGAIYAAIGREIAEGRVASPALLAPSFRGYPGIETVGGAAYLARLAGSAISVYHSRDYARSIRDASRRREIIAACQQGEQIASDMGQPPEAAMAAVESAILSMGDDADEMGARSIFRAMSETIIPMMRDRSEGTEHRGVLSGLPSLDGLTGGLRPGQLIILAGRPGMGKSAVALFLARAAAMQGHGVHMASLEMTTAEIAIRQASLEVWARDRRWVHYDRIINGEIDDDEAKRVILAAQAVEAMPLRLGSERARSLGAIAADARRSAKLFAEQERTLDMLVIDQLSFLTPPRQRQSKVHEVGDLSRAAKELARSLNIPVILLSQLNRSVESREDKRPMLSDLRDSGDVEQDADKVIFAFRDEYYVSREKAPDDEAKLAAFVERQEKARDAIELIVAKNRMGRTGTAKLWCSIGVNAIAETP
jgi:replicative DNA helicase